MTEYLRPLWLGGGISRDALTLIESELRMLADTIGGAPGMEIRNVANAAHAELTKAPAPEVCDLV